MFNGQFQICGEEVKLQKSYYGPLYICIGCMALEGLAFDYEDECWEVTNGYEYDQQQAMREQANDRSKNSNPVAEGEAGA